MSETRADFDAPPPADAEYQDPISRLRLDHNDRDNAVRIYARLGAELVYVPGRDWGAWNGVHFDFDAGNEISIRRVLDVLPGMLEEEIAASDGRPVPQQIIQAFMVENGVDDPSDAEKRIKASRRTRKRNFAVKCGNVGSAKSALEAGRPAFRVHMDDLDADPWRITCQNGVLDLKQIAKPAPDAEDDAERLERWRECLGDFDPSMRGTRTPAARFDPEAEAPRWRQFIDRAFKGDPAGAAYLKRVMGYLLSGRNERQAAVIFLGQGGNGKSTVENAITAVMGGYASTCRIQMFLEQRNAGGMGPTPEEAVLPGARVYLASEPEANAVLSASMIKGITGGTPRQSRHMHTKPFTWTPIGVPVMSFNKMPRITDETEGMWRRLMPVHFQVKLHELPPDERVSPAEVEQILRQEASGILNWMLEGWIEYRDIGLQPPDDVLELKESLRTLSDPVGEFLGDMVKGEIAASISVKEMHEVYERWCERNGAEPLRQRTFNKALRDKNYRTIKNSTMHWRHVAWASPDDVAQLQLGLQGNATTDDKAAQIKGEFDS